MNDDASHGLGPRVMGCRSDIASRDDGRMALAAGMLLVAGVAFGVYWLTAVLLDVRRAAGYFGADADHYAKLAHLLVHHRAARFHPLTTTLGIAWMKAFSPLSPWFSGATLLKAMFAAVGAVGVWAAMWAFAASLPRRYVLLAGVLYGSSFGIWYFSSIPESKIVTATMSVLYVAAYVRLRERWSLPGAVGLSAILALACLNEIVSASLAVIPIVDVLLRRGLDRRSLSWLSAHVSVVLVAWFVLEVLVNGWLIPASAESHFGMLLYYIMTNDHGLASLHGFSANWFFFNIAAPETLVPQGPYFVGSFQPTLLTYLQSPPALAALLVLGLVAVAALLPRYRAAHLGAAGGLLLPLAAFAFVRGLFFFIFNPLEALLFSPAVTLVHWLILLVPFAASRFPAKGALLSVLCVLLIATNAGFMLGPEGWPGLAARFVSH